MKTQRPRERTGTGRTPDTTAGTGDADGNGKGRSPGAGVDGGKPTPAAATLPSLPKRRMKSSAPSRTANAPKTVEIPADIPAGPAAVTEAEPTLKAAAPVVEVADVQAAAAVEAPQAPPKTWHAYITYENVFWFAIFALAIISRFWDIGDRALHHDESLHSVYGGNLYTGAGYQHDPMMHGPLQFHFIAFMYWLFDRTDATVRFASAVCGLFVVMSPFFLKRQMGRWAALICSFLLLVSPSILYYSRMAREDAIYSGMEMIMLVGLWRFITSRKPMDFYIFAAGLSLMFTIKETAYLTLAVLGVLFVLLFIYQAGYAFLGALAGYVAIMGGFLLFMKRMMPSTDANGAPVGGSISKLPDIPQTNPDYDTIKNFAISFITHPLVLGSILITVLFLGVVGWLFVLKRAQLREAGELASPSEGREDGAHETAAHSGLPVRRLGHHQAHGALRPRRSGILSRYEPGSMPYVVGSLLGRPRVLVIGLIVFSVIFVVFYTAMFTDEPRGILSGMFASLGYWIAQQGVMRGGQPWFYYLLLVPLYEPLAIFFSAVGAIFFGYKGIRWLVDNNYDRIENDEPRLGAYNIDRRVPFARFEALFPLFLGWWLVGAFFIYSWAGEKMPWLMMHMARPAIFLASVFLGALVVAMIKARKARFAEAEFYNEEPVMPSGALPSRQRRAVGAHFSLGGFSESARKGGMPAVLAPKLAFEAVPGSTYQYRGGYRGGSGRGAPPPPPPPYRGRGGRAAAAALPAQTYQDPPWVNWNRPGSVAPFAIYLSLFMLLAFAWALSLSQMTKYAADAANLAPDKYASWGVTWLYPIAMLALTAGYIIWLGVGRAMRYLAVAIASVLIIYQFHSSIQLTYRNPDVATEMAVYVQTSPDVTRFMKELQDYSYYSTGGKNVKIIYDSAVSWPFEWYLRDYPNKQFIGGGKPAPGPDVPVIVADYKYLNDADLTKDYVAQRYALRWWFPEEWYKGSGSGSNDGFVPNQFKKDASGQIVTDPVTHNQVMNPPWAQLGDAIHTAWVTVAQPEYQATLWKYLLYKETPKPLGSTDFVVLLRKDIAQQWHALQNEPIPSADVP